MTLGFSAPHRDEVRHDDTSCIGTARSSRFAEARVTELRSRDTGSVDDALQALLATGAWSSRRVDAVTTLRAEHMR